jgi:hypothetical protein
MMPIDRGERSTVSTNYRLAIVVMVSAGLLSCGPSPPLARDGPGGLLAYFHAGPMDGGCQAEHMTSARVIRANSKPDQVRYAAESGSKFRALAARPRGVVG